MCVGAGFSYAIRYFCWLLIYLGHKNLGKNAQEGDPWACLACSECSQTKRDLCRTPQPAASMADGMLGEDSAPDTSCAWISLCWTGGEFTHGMKQTDLFALHFVRWNTNKLRLKPSADDCIFWWIWTVGHNSVLNLPKPVNTGSWTSTSYCTWSSPGSQGSWQLLVSVSSINTAGFNQPVPVTPAVAKRCFGNALVIPLQCDCLLVIAIFLRALFFNLLLIHCSKVASYLSTCRVL